MTNRTWVNKLLSEWLRGLGIETHQIDNISREISYGINQEFEELLKAQCMKDDRNYSQDNTDNQSKVILMACADSCNELRAEIRTLIKQHIKEMK